MGSRKENVSNLVPSGFPGVNLCLGDHICDFYVGEAHLLSKAVPFVVAGLKNREKCIVVLNKSQQEHFKRILQREVGNNLICEKALEIFLAPRMMELFKNTSTKQIKKLLLLKTNEALEMGYKNLRVFAQLELPTGFGRGRFIFLEKSMHQAVSKLPAVVLCTFPFDFNQPKQYYFDIEKVHSFVLSAEKTKREQRRLYVISVEKNNE